MKKLITLIGIILTASIGGVVVADTNPYTDKTSHFEIRNAKGTAGYEKAMFHKNEAKMTLGKWNDEIQMGVEYKGVNGAGKRKLLTDKIEWQGVNEKVVAYPLPNGYEFEVVLSKKPTTNTFDFEITGAGDLDFFYQPALTQQEINDGHNRPANVVGSYAVYHKTNANHRVGGINYTTGKAYHIYRPKIIDDDGNWVWGILDYSGGVLSVTVPQSFLDTATYPVIVDPTFGDTDIGGSTHGDSNGWMRAAKGTPASGDGTVDKISVYGRQTSAGGFSQNHKGIIWLNADGTIISDGVGGVVEVNNTSAQWWDMTYGTSPSVTNGTAYLVGVVLDSSPGSPPATEINYDVQSSGDGGYQVNNYGTPINLTLALTSDDRSYSIYATYTATGGVTETQGNQVGIDNGSTVIDNGRLIIK